MSGRLFRREARLTLARPTAFFAQDEANAVQINNLRVAFQIEKTLRRTPNKCRIQVTNLASQTRAEFKKKPLYARLEVGYDGQLERIFAGDVHHAPSTREGADWTTQIEVLDGLRALRFGRISKSLKSGATALNAVRVTAKELGLTLRLSSAVQAELGAQFSSGVSMQGSAADVMSRLLEPYGVNWSIQDGRLQVLLDSEVNSTTTEVLISQDTGMIGSPEYGDPPERGKPPTLKVKVLIYPSIQPGGAIRIDAREVKGRFKVLAVSHHGDTHGADWETEIECRPL